MAKRKTTITVEYYRLWAGSRGDGGTWDTDFIKIPADTADAPAALDAAVRQAAARIAWREEPPVIVGYYCGASDEEEEGGAVPSSNPTALKILED